MKIVLPSLLLVAALAAAGCGSSDNASATEANAFKNHDKSALKSPPADAMKAPSDFKSSLGSSAGGGSAVPGAGGK